MKAVKDPADQVATWASGCPACDSCQEARPDRGPPIQKCPPFLLRSQICNKQYQTAMQLDEHLSSYDHHHRKRMAETHAMLAARGKKDRDRRRRKEADRELAALTEQ